MLQGNKGEWSEVYTLLKLLGDKKLFSGDKDLNKIEELYYPIIKILRDESGINLEYELDDDIVIISNNSEVTRLSIDEFKKNATILLSKIKSSDETFRVVEIERFLDLISCKSLKAKSSKKTDIRIVIHDVRLDRRQELGFSIKSHLGGDSTLLNATKPTNFIYKIENFNQTDLVVESINNISSPGRKIKERLFSIDQLGGILVYNNLENQIFKNNLILIDTGLPIILAEIVKIYFTTKLNSIKEIVERINISNPLQLDNTYNHKFYEYKIKRFLVDIALGMMASKVWDGIYDATGGYLVVKEDGEVLCYHLYDRNKFEDYLFNNTRLETGSSTRHEFAKIFQKDGESYFKLNLQIRFKK